MRVKRLFKLGAWTAGVLAGVLAILLFTALTTVDQSSYRRLPCLQETAARLQQSRGQTNIVFGELYAGFGRAKLTPVLDAERDDPSAGRFRFVPLAGYGARHGQPATGIHQDVWVKAVAFAVGGRTGVIASADALIIPRPVAESAASRLLAARGLSRAALYFSATHGHSSLGGWGEGYVAEQFSGPHVPGIREWFAQQLAGAALAAIDDLSPAALGHGGFSAPDLVRNRLVGEAGTKDPEFALLLIKQADGDSTVIGSYAAHATVLSASNMGFSGDYPGYWALGVEKLPHCMAMFLAGGVGSHGPRAGKPGLAGAQLMGDTLAERTVAALTGIAVTNHVAFGVLGIPLNLPALQIRLNDGVRLRPWLAQGLLPAPADTFLQGFRLEKTVWLSTPCDFSGELALELKRSARTRGMTAAVTSFNGDYVGYVIPAKYYHRNGYEPRTMSFYGPQLPGYFMETLETMIEVLADPR